MDSGITVLILAAGYATRLYPLTENKPKPLLPVAGSPMVEHIIRKVEALHGSKDIRFGSIVIVTNGRFYSQFTDWQKKLRCAIPVRILNDATTSDKDKLGAVGDMGFVLQSEGDQQDFLVVGGDNLFDFSLADFLVYARKSRPFASVGLYDVGPGGDARKYSAVKLDDDGRVISFVEKPKVADTTLISICMYYFPKEKLWRIGQYLTSGNNQDQPGHYIAWLANEDKVYGFVFQGRWFDIGDIASYNEANSVMVSRL
jgi:glucose-1-phosphate thymidylyltransferase